MTKKRTKERSGHAYDSGLEIARQLGEEALTVASPISRFLTNTAIITETTDLDFTRKAIHRKLINDTLEKIRKESDIITVERMISAIVSGKYKDHLKDKKDKDKDKDEDDEKIEGIVK